MHLHSIPCFNDSTVKSLGRYCGKRRNCTERAISPFPTMFSMFSLENPFIFFCYSFKFVVCKSFQLGKVQNYLGGKKWVKQRYLVLSDSIQNVTIIVKRSFSLFKHQASAEISVIARKTE